MNKKILSVICGAAICFLPVLGGCSLPKQKDSDKLSIVTTSFPPYDFARAVAGDSAKIEMLLSTGAEAHSYEPTPLDIAEIQNCDVFICIGGEDEVWVDEILDSIDTSDIKVIRLFDYAELLEEEEIQGASPTGHHHHHHDDDEHEHEHEEDEEDEHEHGETEEFEADGHIWTSPENAIRCMQGVEDEMCSAFPEKAELFRKNGSEYIAELQELDSEFREMTENAPSNVIVVGDRFPFRYLSHDYGLEYFAAFSGCSSESEPTVRTMAFLIDEIKEHDMDTVFYLEFSTKKLAEKLCDATGADMLPLYSCHNVTKEDFESGVTYIDLMKTNLQNLREALY